MALVNQRDYAARAAASDRRAVDRRVADRRQTGDRRARGWHAFMYGNFRPRRKLMRRDVDEHLLLLDWYEPRLLYLTLGVMLLSCVDALFTLNLLNHGATEANIVMASALGHGMDWFLACKISLTGFSLVVLVSVVRRRLFRSYSVEHLLQFFFATYLLVIVYEIYLFEYVFDLRILFNS